MDSDRFVNSDCRQRQAVIIDDHVMIIDSLRALIKSVDPFMRVLSATSLADAVLLLRSNLVASDVVFVDLTLRDSAGLATLNAVLSHSPGATVAVVSGTTNEQLIREVFATDASAFIPKDLDAPTLQQAVRAVLESNFWCPAGVLDRPGLELSEQQRAVLALLYDGLPNKAIARKLDLSLSGVKYHVTALMQSLQARTRGEVAANARRLGLL